MSSHVLPLSPNDHPTTASGSRGLSGVTVKPQFVSQTRAGLRTAQQSLVGPNRGAELGKLNMAPGTPVTGQAVHIKEKSGTGPGSESRHSGGYRPNQVLPPPPPHSPPHTPKKWTPGMRRRGLKIENIHWGTLLSPRMMIPHGAGHPTSRFGVCYANEPQKRWAYWRLCLRLIYPLFTVIFRSAQNIPKTQVFS